MCHFIAVTELFSLHVSPKWLMFPASFSSHFLLLPPPQNRTLAFPFYGHVFFSKEGPPSHRFLFTYLVPFDGFLFFRGLFCHKKKRIEVLPAKSHSCAIFVLTFYDHPVSMSSLGLSLLAASEATVSEEFSARLR